MGNDLTYATLIDSSPKHKNSVIIFSHVVTNPFDLLSSVNHKRRHFEVCAGCSFPFNYNEWGLKLSNLKGLIHIIKSVINLV